MRFNLRMKSLLWTATAAVMVLATSTGWSQGESAQDKSIPTSKVERLNRAPVSKEILQVKLPRPVEATLSNGINVMILEDHRFPLVTVQFDINGSGPIYEPASQPGLAGAPARLLEEGTKTRTSKQIAEQIDSLGASLSASAGLASGSTILSASELSDTFDQWFGLTMDVLLHPNFPADELAQYKARTKPALLQQRSQPSFLANQALNRALYGEYPAAVVSATPESVDSLTSAMLADWHVTHTAPLIPKLRQWLAEWQRSKTSVAFPPGPPPAAKGKVFLVDRPGSVQTTLLMGNLAIERSDPDYPALVVLNEVLGAGSASRLFLNLREDKGYPYGAYSSVIARKYAGPWTASSEVRTEVTDGAMTEVPRELNRIRDEKKAGNEL